jgi:aspartate racemase
MSWESSLHYYRLINETVRDRLGGHHSADLVMVSLDFAPIEEMQRQDAWGAAAALLAKAAKDCLSAGAEGLLLCTNTMHVVAEALEEAVEVPLLHIADATGGVIEKSGLRRIGLLGTSFTMEREFYRRRLEERFGLEILVPEEEARRDVHRVIFEELVLGAVNAESKERYLAIIEELAQAGAEGIILGCTEIGMLLSPGDHRLPLFDTTEIHAAAAVEWMLEEDESI